MSKLKKRLDGRYQLQIYLGKSEDGKRIVKTVYGRTQKECQQKADEIKSQLGKGIDVLAASSAFSDWAKVFLNLQKNIISEQAYNKKKSNIEQFYSAIGNIPIISIKPIDVQLRLNELQSLNPYTGKPSSAKTIKEYRNNLSQVFRYAMVNRVLPSNPCDGVKLPKTESFTTKERRALTAAERLNIEQCECYAKFPAMIAMYAGLRRGEITALTWNDIDLDNRIITVNKSYNHKTKSLKTTKTKSGIRTVPMPRKLIDEFEKIPQSERTGLVVSVNGDYVTEGYWRSWIAELLTELDCKFGNGETQEVKIAGKRTIMISLEPFDWHCLRHTYATILYESGTDVLTAREFLGHSDVSTTMRIYTHLSDAQKSKSISRLDNFLSENF